MKIRYIIVFLLISLTGCNSHTKEFNKFEQYLKTYHHENIQNDHIYVIIPLNICHSCIEKMLMILNSPKTKQNITVILADYTSVTLKEKTKYVPQEILLDNKMLIYKKHIISGNYIEILSVTNNKLNKITYQPDINDTKVKNVLYHYC